MGDFNSIPKGGNQDAYQLGNRIQATPADGLSSGSVRQQFSIRVLSGEMRENLETSFNEGRSCCTIRSTIWLSFAPSPSKGTLSVMI